VPPQHLMCPVHSSNEQRPGHPAGGVPILSTGRQYARAAAYTMLMMTRALPRKQPRDINTIWTTDIMALGDLLGDTGIGYFYMYSLCFAPRPKCRGSAPLYVPPLSYKREGTRRYKAASLRPNLGSSTLTLTQTHKFIQALKLNTTHSGVGYYTPAARTTLNPCVFLCSSRFHLAGKTLRPLPILGFRAGAFRHPAREFPLRHLHYVHYCKSVTGSS
jgi:hypothetical protein